MISICIPITISNLIFHGTGCKRKVQEKRQGKKRWSDAAPLGIYVAVCTRGIVAGGTLVVTLAQSVAHLDLPNMYLSIHALYKVELDM